MRIAYLNPCGQMGGAETSLIELLSSVRAAEPRWDLWLVLGEEGPLAEKARKAGVQVRLAPFPKALSRLGDAGAGPKALLWPLAKAGAGIARYRWRLRNILNEIQPDLIHTNGFKMHLLGAWSAPSGIPLVWHVHDYVSTRRMMSQVLRKNASRCAAVIVNSHSVASDLQKVLPGHRPEVLYNAIDLDRFAPVGMRADLDALSGMPPAEPGTVRVGLVGTFATWKGHKVFLQALAQLSATTPVRGYIIGGPIYQTSGSQWSLEELAAEAERLGIRHKVGFTGMLDDPADAMRSLDIVVHASTAPEPFGMVIIEGMACGRAVVASKAGGAVELFDDDRTALGCPPGDARTLARHIDRLAEDPSLRERLGKAARSSVLQRFDRNRLAEGLIRLYRACAGAQQEPVLQSR